MIRRSLPGRLLAAFLLLAPGAAAEPIRVVSYFAASTLDPHPGGSGWFLQSHGVAETLFCAFTYQTQLSAE